MPHFGVKLNDDPDVGTWTEPFTFGTMTSDGPVQHEFTARLGKIPAGAMLAAMSAIDRGDVAAAAKVYTLSIAKMIDNRDGLAARWQPVPLPRAEGDDRPEVFRVPWGPAKGELRPLDEADEYVRDTPPSSRRRWIGLMEDDEDAMVQFADLQALFEWMVAQSTGNRSAASS